MAKLRFRCPECSRALAAPMTAIGKRIGCPFCQTIYEVSLVIDVEPTPPPVADPVSPPISRSPNLLSRWIPPSVMAAGGDAANMAGTMAGNAMNAVKTTATAGFQIAQSTASAGMSTASNAANAVGASVNAGAKRAVSAVAPLTQHAAGVASAIIPGTGELMTGNVTQGSCTFAAFLGAASAVIALAPLIPATPVVGVVVAVPLGIQVFSAWQGSKHGKRAAENIQAAISDSLTADEVARAAANMRAAAASMSQEEFERTILEAEERELQVVETGQQRIVLKRAN